MKNFNSSVVRREPTLPSFGTDKSLLSDIKSCVQDDLAQMEKEIERGFASEIELVGSISTHIAGFGGKRLRPLTVILTARAFDYEGTLHCTLGAILEMLHGGTLLHDDVVDTSEVRRGRPSANMIWGNSASVLVGDFILSRSFELIAELQIPRILDILAYTTRRISEGEIMQLTSLRDANSDEANYFDTIERKTAALFEASSRLGALAANTSSDVEEQIGQYGRELGISFQLQDDLLDYQGDTKLIGKKVGDDLSEGKLTMPLLRTLNTATAGNRKILKRAIMNPNTMDFQEIYNFVVSSDALEYTSHLARDYCRKAQKRLEFLPDSVYCEALSNLAEFACVRTF